MAKKKLRTIKLAGNGFEVKVSLNRFDRCFRAAQYYLDGQVMTDMVPRMPHNTGVFVNKTRAQSAALQGTGKVIAAAGPEGQFLYGGLVMVDPVTNSPWARPGAQKIITDRPLTYSNPRAVPHWFDAAKEANCKNWVKGVKRIAGGN